MTRSAPPAALPAAAPRRRAAGPSRRPLVAVFAAVSLVAAGGLGYLGWEGYQITKRIVGGSTVESITDPAAPGYVAAVTPTPVHLLAVVDDDGRARDFTVLIEGTEGEGGGTVLWVVGDLAIDTDAGKVPLSDTYRDEGGDAVRAMLEVILGWGITDVTEVGAEEFAALFEPVGAVEVRNPDAVRAEGGGPSFPAGTVPLEPDEVGDFLLVRGRGEVPTNRATRAELAWSALFEGLAELGSVTGSAGGSTAEPAGGSAGGAGATAGSEVLTDRGTDLLVATRTMAQGEVGFVVLPVRDERFGPTRLYVPDPDRTPDAVAGLVQVPVSAYPGQRPRTEIYNGTTDLDAARAAVPSVADAGAEVVAIGNARTLDREVTTVEFHDPSWEQAAGRIAELFGVEPTLSSDQTDGKDVTVTLGPDGAPEVDR